MDMTNSFSYVTNVTTVFHGTLPAVTADL